MFVVLVLRLADTVIHVIQNERHAPDNFSCTFEDLHTGKNNYRLLSNVQLGAILALMLGGEDYQPELTKLLYEIAEPAIAGLDKECRPIP